MSRFTGEQRGVSVAVSVSVALVLLGCGSGAAAGGGAAGAATGSSGAAGSLAAAGGASGATGSGGSATGGAPAIVTVKTDCSKLPAAGTWENISPPAFLNPSNMETLAVAVNPVDHTVFAAAGNKTNGGNAGTGVYRSADCGASWLLISTGAGGDQLQSGDPWALLIDPVTPQTMYIDNGYGGPPTVFKTTNGGVDWTPLSPDVGNFLAGGSNSVQAIAMDPAKPEHIAVTFHDTCNGPYNGLCLSESDDAGATWHEFAGPPQVMGWREAASLGVLGASTYLYTCDLGGYYTADTGKTWKQVFTQTIAGSYAGSAHFGPDGTLYLGVTNNGIFSSKPSANSPVGSSWTAIPGSPNTSMMTDDGTNLIASYSWDYGGQPFYMAPLSGLTPWVNMQSPKIGRGSNQLAYDSEHHVAYAANWGAGLWRLVTP
jgi:hypothetical protein